MARRSRPPGYPGRPRTRTPRSRKAQEDRRAILIVAASVLALIGAGAFAWWSRTPALDQATGCPQGQLIPKTHTVVLVDQTDALSPRQINYAKSLILLEYQRLPPGGRLTVRPIDENPQSVARDFSRCRVRRGNEVSGIATNPDLIEAEFRRSVGDALNGYLEGLETQATAPASPIIETIDTVAEAADFGGNVETRRLVVLSDMAQKSDVVDQYRDPGFYQVGPARGRADQPLEGVTARIHYLRRPELARLQTESHRQYWREWFEAGGADAELGWGLQMVEAEARPAR